jgi:hypothetical protein
MIREICKDCSTCLHNYFIMHIFKGSKGAIVSDSEIVISWKLINSENTCYLFYHYHAVHFLEHYNLSDVSCLCSGDEMKSSVTIKQKSTMYIFIIEFCSQLPISTFFQSSSGELHITFVVISYYSIVVKWNQLSCH